MPFRKIAAAGLLAALTTTAAWAQPTSLADGPARTITVGGTGEAAARPDLATASFTVQRIAKTAREAVDLTNKAMADVLAGMKELGVEARDLQTSGFGVMPQYRYDDGSDGRQDPPELVGYQVQNSVSVRVRDLGRTGDILDRAVSLGVNAGGDISFGIDDPAPLRLEARRKAVRDATATATALAAAANVVLGDVVSITATEEGFPPPPPMPMARMAMEAAPAPMSSVPVEAGETRVRASVTMTFALGGSGAPN